MSKNLIYMTCLMLTAVIAVLLFLFAGQNCNRDDDELKIFHDTIIKTVRSEPIVITKMKTKIIKLSDTVIQYHPFRALVDTVIMHDTIHSYYEFPEGLFSLEYKPARDTFRFERTAYRKVIRQSEKWWEKPLIIVGSVLAGYTIGRVR